MSNTLEDWLENITYYNTVNLHCCLTLFALTAFCWPLLTGVTGIPSLSLGGDVSLHSVDGIARVPLGLPYSENFLF